MKDRLRMTMVKNDKKTIFGWCMYDWANSAYITTVVTAILPSYFASVIVGKEGLQIGNTVVSATSLWGYMVSFSAFFVFLFAPVLGAISDFSSAKKKFLMSFAYTGSLFAILLYFCQSGDVWKTVVFFIISQIGFVAANVFYDAFLPQIASEDKLDWISGKGFSFGYIGGGLQFAIALGLVAGYEVIGISQEMAARIGMTMAGFWWVHPVYAEKSQRGRSCRRVTGDVSIQTKVDCLCFYWVNSAFCNRQKSQTFQASSAFSNRLYDL